MPRQRIHHNTMTRAFPEGLPQRLKRFQADSGLPWGETARRVGAEGRTSTEKETGRADGAGEEAAHGPHQAENREHAGAGTGRFRPPAKSWTPRLYSSGGD